MEMSGEQRVPLAQEEVWKSLNDPDVLKACIPGCESVDKVSDTEFKASVNTRIGPVRSRFKGRVTLSDLDPPNSYKLSFQGDGTAGFIKGEADVKLTPEGEQNTAIGYTSKATVGGKLAQVGSRLIDGAARKMANDFFSNLTRELGGTYQTPEAAGPEKAPEPAQQPEPTPEAEPPVAAEEPAAEAEPVAARDPAREREPAPEPVPKTAPTEPARTSATEVGNRRALWVAIVIVIVLIILYFALG